MDVAMATERLALRRFTRSDAALLAELDGDLTRYVTGRPTPRVRIEAAVLTAVISDHTRHLGLGVFAAHTTEGGEFTGWFMLLPRSGSPPGEAELGYRLRRPAWVAGTPPGVPRIAPPRVRRTGAAAQLRGDHGDVCYALDRDEWRAGS